MTQLTNALDGEACVEDISEYDEDLWEDFEDDRFAPPQITYREAVERLLNLASKRTDVRVEWDGKQEWDGRRWRTDARVVFPEADGLRAHLKSAAQLHLFERIVSSGIPLPERHAIWYPQEGVITARLVGDFDQFHSALVRSVLPRQKRAADLEGPLGADLAAMLASTGAFCVSEAADGSGRSLRLVSVPPELSLLYNTRHGGGLSPSVELSGVSVSNAAEAQKALVAYGTSYLFGLAKAQGASLRLWDTGYRLGSRRGPSYSKKIRFPQRQYDAEPAELYGAGNAAGRHPVERYLKYYQVLEFYMPKAVDWEVTQQGVAGQNQAQSPYIRPPKDGSLRIEQNQLDAVINLAVTQADVAGLLRDRDLFTALSNPQIIQHVETLEHDGSGAPLLSSDYRKAVSSRVYGIRNRIVHMKEGGGVKGAPLLGLHSREARDLAADLRLLRYLAEKAMERWATALP
ncbi:MULTISPECIES: hypothetical protein [Streptomyces albogriseolus group]|uniref:hypothetical protein n=1 Tax=Streptomyces albogriseolus group TaxID=2867120 RepID=UPI0018764AE3